MTRSPLLLAISLCGLALAGAGCGDDDNDALSYEETGEEISAICREYDTSSEEEKLTGRVAKDAPVLARINEDTEQGLSELRDLEVHEELADARDDLVSVVEGSLERGQSLQTLAEAGDQQGYLKKIRELQRASRDLNAEADAAASKLGAPACGQNA